MNWEPCPPGAPHVVGKTNFINYYPIWKAGKKSSRYTEKVKHNLKMSHFLKVKSKIQVRFFSLGSICLIMIHRHQRSNAFTFFYLFFLFFIFFLHVLSKSAFFKAYPTDLSKTLLSTIFVSQTEFYFWFWFQAPLMCFVLQMTNLGKWDLQALSWFYILTVSRHAMLSLGARRSQEEAPSISN